MRTIPLSHHDTKSQIRVSLPFQQQPFRVYDQFLDPNQKLHRIAQLDTGTLAPEYFLGDALGSVRQMTDAAGAITYARSYDPGVYPEQG